MKKIDIATADDWTALYIDGKVVYQNHSIEAVEVLELLGITYTQHDFEGDLDEWGNRFPKTVKELGVPE